MEDGLYKVAFKTPLGEGFGVLTLAGGRATGGDGGMWYAGNFTEEGGKVQAAIRVGRHSQPGAVASVFGTDNVHINLAGTSTGDNSAVLRGTAPEAPGVQFSATMTRIAAAG